MENEACLFLSVTIAALGEQLTFAAPSAVLRAAQRKKAHLQGIVAFDGDLAHVRADKVDDFRKFAAHILQQPEQVAVLNVQCQRASVKLQAYRDHLQTAGL